MQIIDKSATEDLVVPILAEWVGQKKTFTPWDITQAVRAANPDTNIEHMYVRQIVRDYMFNVDYSMEIRSYTDPQGNPVSAITFFVDEDATPPSGLNTVPATLDVTTPAVGWDL